MESIEVRAILNCLGFARANIELVPCRTHCCRPYSDAVWHPRREEVMRTAVRAKFEASIEARELLLSTAPHPLLSIKGDRVWGFDPRFGGANLLAKLCTELRDDLLQQRFPVTTCSTTSEDSVGSIVRDLAAASDAIDTNE
jgi:hypothetical protein